MGVGYLLDILPGVDHFELIDALEPHRTTIFRRACYPVDILGQRIGAVGLHLYEKSGVVEYLHQRVGEL